jgi:tetratricopeptide (TPR) repeat protein
VGCVLVAAAMALAALPVRAQRADDGALCLKAAVGSFSGWSINDKKVFDRLYDLRLSCTRIIESRKASETDLVTAFANRGTASRILHDFDAAIADLDQAIRRNPGLASAYSNRGMAYRGKDDDDRAIADYDQAIGRDPKLVEAYSARAESYRRKVRVAEGDDRDIDGDLVRLGHVVADRDQAFRLDPTNTKLRDALTESLVYRGHLYEYDNTKRTKDHARAVADYSEALRIDPVHFDALFSRCDAYREIKDYERAIADCKAAIGLDPQRAMLIDRQLQLIDLQRRLQSRP